MVETVTPEEAQSQIQQQRASFESAQRQIEQQRMAEQTQQQLLRATMQSQAQRRTQEQQFTTAKAEALSQLQAQRGAFETQAQTVEKQIAEVKAAQQEASEWEAARSLVQRRGAAAEYIAKGSEISGKVKQLLSSMDIGGQGEEAFLSQVAGAPKGLGQVKVADLKVNTSGFITPNVTVSESLYKDIQTKAPELLPMIGYTATFSQEKVTPPSQETSWWKKYPAAKGGGFSLVGAYMGGVEAISGWIEKTKAGEAIIKKFPILGQPETELAKAYPKSYAVAKFAQTNLAYTPLIVFNPLIGSSGYRNVGVTVTKTENIRPVFVERPTGIKKTPLTFEQPIDVRFSKAEAESLAKQRYGAEWDTLPKLDKEFILSQIRTKVMAKPSILLGRQPEAITASLEKAKLDILKNQPPKVPEISLTPEARSIIESRINAQEARFKSGAEYLQAVQTREGITFKPRPSETPEVLQSFAEQKPIIEIKPTIKAKLNARAQLNRLMSGAEYIESIKGRRGPIFKIRPSAEPSVLASFDKRTPAFKVTLSPETKSIIGSKFNAQAARLRSGAEFVDILKTREGLNVKIRPSAEPSSILGLPKPEPSAIEKPLFTFEKLQKVKIEPALKNLAEVETKLVKTEVRQALKPKKFINARDLFAPDNSALGTSAETKGGQQLQVLEKPQVVEKPKVETIKIIKTKKTPTTDVFQSQELSFKEGTLRTVKKKVQVSVTGTALLVRDIAPIIATTPQIKQQNQVFQINIQRQKQPQAFGQGQAQPQMPKLYQPQAQPIISALSFKQPQIERLSQPQEQPTRQRERQREEIIQKFRHPTKERTPKENLLSTSKVSSLLGKVRGYVTMVKRRGKFTALAGLRTKAEAIKLGEKVSRTTLARTFSVKEAGAIVSTRTPQEYLPSRQAFRTYQIRKGRQIPLKDTFIQIKALTRGTGEVPEIQLAKKQKGGKLKWL